MVNNNEFIVSAKNLSKVYRTRTDVIKVFENLNIDIESGSSTAIIGESGRGKTTLLNLLSGLDRPSSGTIYFRQFRIDDKSEEKLSEFRNRNIGFIFQHHYLLDDFTAIENVTVPMRIKGTSGRKDINDRGRELLSKMGLKDRLNHYPDQLSGGERQRVAIARALVNDPEIIFADEPTGSLDRRNSANIEEILWELKETLKKTFIIATHNLYIAKKCDKIIDLG